MKNNKKFTEQLEFAINFFTKKLQKSALEKGDKELAEQIIKMGAISFKLLEIISSNKVSPDTKLKALTLVINALEKKQINWKDYNL